MLSLYRNPLAKNVHNIQYIIKYSEETALNFDKKLFLLYILQAIHRIAIHSIRAAFKILSLLANMFKSCKW